jgi:hypothetical protein
VPRGVIGWGVCAKHGEKGMARAKGRFYSICAKLQDVTAMLQPSCFVNCFTSFFSFTSLTDKPMRGVMVLVNLFYLFISFFLGGLT